MVNVKDRHKPGLLGEDVVGAYVNILASANGEDDFKNQIINAINDYGLELISIDDMDKYCNRINNYSTDSHIKLLAKELIKTGGLRFGTFHVYS
ncbi:MAG: hypothetical protein NDI73_01535 [Desulfuromonadales bacterium]|nr:hypothetical protein [Desulfuromonadales bacterium]